jgi:PEP-CTERM motif
MKSLPKVKSLSLAVGLAFAMSTGVANADTTVNAGQLGATPYTGYFFYSPGTTFHDIINFNIATPSVLSVTAINVSNLTTFDISGLTGKLFDSSNHQIGMFSSPTSSFSTILGVDNNYHFDFSGNVTGSVAGMYTFSLGAVSAPVPEPGTYAMFLAALGLIGAIAVRGKKNI